MWTIAYTFLGLYLRAMTTSGEAEPAGCWPQNIVPFKISHGFNYSQEFKIKDVIKEFNRFTCVRWVDGDKVPYNATDRVVFQKVQPPYICRTQKILLSNGGEVTVIQLGDSCFKKPVLMHEMMHVLGFSHEHQRADRDCYIFVDDKHAEVPISGDEIDIKHERWLERFPYDKHSNMHYPRSTLIKARLKMSKPRQAILNFSEDPLGNVKGDLTFLDLWKILYKFRGFPHYCDVFPPICVLMDEALQSREAPNYSVDPLGNVKGDLSFFDVWKILYKFCDFPHYCDVFPEICFFMDEVEKSCVKKPP